MAPALKKKPDLSRYLLNNGDHMSQTEFHRAYKNTPENFRAELVGGIVFVASPLKKGHGENHLPLGSAFFAYETVTPGTVSGDNSTIMLGEHSEPQPDLYLRVEPEYGGQSIVTEDDYISGAPELVAEIALSSSAIDLNLKRQDYARHGVREYMVLLPMEKEFRWFDLSRDRENALPIDSICRSRAFPGLWIHVKALLEHKHKLLTRTIKRGLASPEHAAFVKKLEAAKRKRGREK